MLIFTEGFDDQIQFAAGTVSTVKWQSVSAVNSDISNGNGRRSSIGLRGTSNSGTISNAHYYRHYLTASEEHATLTMGFSARFSGGTTLPASLLVEFDSDYLAAAVSHVQLFVNANGSMSVCRGNGTNVGSAGAIWGTTNPGVIVSDNVARYIEFSATLHDTTGSLELRVDGNPLLVLTGIDTKNGGVKTVFDRITFHPIGLNPLWGFYDDIYVNNGAGTVNTSFLGDTNIECVRPTGNGFYSQWTGSDGNSVDNYLLIDEGVATQVDYTTSVTAGQRDTVTMGDLSSVNGFVRGMTVVIHALKMDSGTRFIKPVIRSGVTDNVGPDKFVGITQTPVFHVYETNVVTGLPFTPAEFNALEVGYECGV